MHAQMLIIRTRVRTDIREDRLVPGSGDGSKFFQITSFMLTFSCSRYPSANYLHILHISPI